MCATEFDWETILEEMLGRIAPLEDEVRRLREENFTLDKELSWDKHVVIPDLERQISELKSEGTPLARLTYLSNEAARLGIITPHSSTPPERCIIAAIESLQRQVARLAKEAGYRSTF